VTAARRDAGRRSLILAMTLVLASISILSVFVTPGKGDEDDAESVVHAPMRVTIKNGVVVLTLSAADQLNDGIVTTALAPAPENHVVIGYGSVLDAANLADLSNRYLGDESAVQTAQAKLAVSRAALERARVLHRDQQNISTAQLQDAEGNFEIDKAAFAAARSRRSTGAAGVRQAWGNVLGAALIGQTPLISDLIERRDYLVKVTLPPGATVAVPPITATTTASGGSEIALDFISPATSTDPRLQGVSYFYKASAESGLLPGLHLEVSLTTKGTERGFVVPEPAVVWSQGKAWVYLRTGPTTFERREISPDHPAPDGGYIVAGVSADAQIVVRGAQMLLSEEFRAQAPIED
jgi:hypothetical protein